MPVKQKSYFCYSQVCLPVPADSVGADERLRVLVLLLDIPDALPALIAFECSQKKFRSDLPRPSYSAPKGDKLAEFLCA